MLQAELDSAIAEERYEDAAKVMAEGSLSLIGTWVGKNDSGNDPYGCVVSRAYAFLSEFLSEFLSAFLSLFLSHPILPRERLSMSTRSIVRPASPIRPFAHSPIRSVFHLDD
jgi:hypothetical protein